MGYYYGVNFTDRPGFVANSTGICQKWHDNDKISIKYTTAHEKRLFEIREAQKLGVSYADYKRDMHSIAKEFVEINRRPTVINFNLKGCSCKWLGAIPKP
jgi:hypothetical protein